MDSPALPFGAPPSVERQVVKQQKDDRWQKQVGDQRMTTQPVDEPAPRPPRAILSHGEAGRIEVTAEQSTVEIVPVSVMCGMTAPPICVRSECDQAARQARGVVSAARGEECAMSAVV